MDSYAIARAESRITELEFEVRRLKNDVQRIESQPSLVGDFLTPLMWIVSCGVIGISVGAVVAKLIKLLQAA